MRIRVRITDESACGTRELIVTQLPLTVGRGSSNDVPLDDLSASKAHALVDERDGRLVVLDRGSRNGTFAKGGELRVREDEPTPLDAIGFEFSIGSATLHVDHDPNAGEAEPTSNRRTLSLPPNATTTYSHRGLEPKALDASSIPVQLRPAYERYRAARADLLGALDKATCTLDEQHRAHVFKLLSLEFAVLAHDDAFQVLARRGDEVPTDPSPMVDDTLATSECAPGPWRTIAALEARRARAELVVALLTTHADRMAMLTEIDEDSSAGSDGVSSLPPVEGRCASSRSTAGHVGAALRDEDDARELRVHLAQRERRAASALVGVRRTFAALDPVVIEREVDAKRGLDCFAWLRRSRWHDAWRAYARRYSESVGRNVGGKALPNVPQSATPSPAPPRPQSLQTPATY